MNHSESQNGGAKILLKSSNLEEILTADEAAKLLGVSCATFNKYANKEHLKHIIKEHNSYYFKSDIDALLKKDRL